MKLREFLENEIANMYANIGPIDVDTVIAEAVADLHAVETFENVVHVAFTLPKPYRKNMLRQIAVFFEDSPDYKEKWRP